MKKTSIILMAILMVVMYVPASSATEPVALKPAQVKIMKSAVLAEIERAHGPLMVVCPGARPELAAYNRCKEQCAVRAEQTPITPADLASCGNMTAQQCAAWLVAKRAKECIETAGVGCADELAKFKKENAECKKCAELKTAEAAAERDVAAKASALAAAHAAFHRAQGALSVAIAHERAIEMARKKMCAAAAK